jgi:hypothetical protein
MINILLKDNKGIGQIVQTFIEEENITIGLCDYD